MKESAIERAVKTELPPCCLRILQDEFVLVGTYYLDKPTGNRIGSVDVFDKNLQLLKSYKTYGAILDLKLSTFDEKLVATAHSTGNVTLWRVSFVDQDETSIDLEVIGSLQVFEVDTLITSLHFSPLDANLLLVTNTLGESALIDITRGNLNFSSNALKDTYSKIETSSLKVQGLTQQVIKTEPESFSRNHSLECWTGEFGELQPLQNVVFTGGDDATIIAHDLRSKKPIWSNSRIHEAGVVAIKCSSPTFRHAKPTSIITGSYDDHIRTLDLRMLGTDSIYPGENTPVIEKWEYNLGGGVWRFSECPKKLGSSSYPAADTDQLLVCCMYNGAKIVSLSQESSTEEDDCFKVVNYLNKGHESMCYGGDWCSDFIVTCSFYDNSLQKWRPQESCHI